MANLSNQVLEHEIKVAIRNQIKKLFEEEDLLEMFLFTKYLKEFVREVEKEYLEKAKLKNRKRKTVQNILIKNGFNFKFPKKPLKNAKN